MASCIPSCKGRISLQVYGKILYKQQYKVENLFAKLKDWRRIATHYVQNDWNLKTFALVDGFSVDYLSRAASQKSIGLISRQ